TRTSTTMALPTAQAAAQAAAKSAFTPRQFFDASSSITRSYFLGHHNAALNRMRRVLSNVGLVVECRDIRVPLTSWNPMLESSLMYNTDFRERKPSPLPSSSSSSPPSTSQTTNANTFTGGANTTGGRARIIVYTHRDLIDPSASKRLTTTLRAFHQRELNTVTLFHGTGTETRDTKRLLAEVRNVAHSQHSLTGLRALVVGMPNAGKSTLLNRMRTHGAEGSGVSVAKVARTGAEPGVTRKLGTPVRILPADEHSEGVYLLDTPGVFVPFVPEAESMLKLALVGCVKDGLISWVTVADYLLYHLNLHDPTGQVYADYCEEPTNDVHVFLKGVARRTGKLVKGSGESMEAAADWVVRRWRNGGLGRFVLDTVNEETLAQARRKSLEPPLSMNQARKRDKEDRRDRAAAKNAGR
ncbi:P-loop containing nucleoside triphosphate hydrolase protein, partial [Coniella lustricola]